MRKDFFPQAVLHVSQKINLMTLCQKCYLFLISELSWKDFVTRNEINQFLFVSHTVDVLGYVLRVVWWLWSTVNLFKCSKGLWYRRQPPRLVNLHSFGLVASLVNTLPVRPPYATAYNTMIYYPKLNLISPLLRDLTPFNKFTTSFGAVCRTDVQMTWMSHAHREPK